MAKQMIYGEEARKKLLDGITAATDAIKVTLGPKARTVVLDRSLVVQQLSMMELQLLKI
uniref:Chaperonin GroEL (HSP60 family) n=1 Tax=uncultured marine group II/III euryarchaeote AD1000_53_H05 TaxID=1457782 RepID=A0A075FTV1_9EURY|nr:Chaperonin GroEL (HSP60 family) [uncultured marine group II/III euryarchaeote AD1000_53_H05]